eukprot:g38890.t1
MVPDASQHIFGSGQLSPGGKVPRSPTHAPVVQSIFDHPSMRTSTLQKPTPTESRSQLSEKGDGFLDNLSNPSPLAPLRALRPSALGNSEVIADPSLYNQTESLEAAREKISPMESKRERSVSFHDRNHADVSFHDRNPADEDLFDGDGEDLLISETTAVVPRMQQAPSIFAVTLSTVSSTVTAAAATSSNPTSTSTPTATSANSAGPWDSGSAQSPRNGPRGSKPSGFPSPHFPWER